MVFGEVRNHQVYVVALHIGYYYEMSCICLGMFVALSGIIGFVGGSSKRKSVIIFYMALSFLIASCIVAAMMIISYIGYTFDTVWVMRSTVTGWSYSQKLACSYNLVGGFPF